jgi:hypothetical protein
MKSYPHKLLNKKCLVLITFFLLAFAERVYVDLGPNFELITMSMILVSYYYGRKEAFWLTFAIIAFSDRFMGNSSIFLFTWSGFLLPAIFSKALINRLTDYGSRIKTSAKIIVEPLSMLSAGFTFNVFYYTWTNFGVWYLDSFNMYPNTLNGLAMSYVNGLPFLRLHLTSTLIFIPAGFLIVELVKNYSKNLLPSIASAKS